MRLDAVAQLPVNPRSALTRFAQVIKVEDQRNPP
jgi:hypothetical protein